MGTAKKKVNRVADMAGVLFLALFGSALAIVLLLNTSEVIRIFIHSF